MAVCVIGILVGADQLAKQWVLAHLAGAGASVMLPGPVNFTLVLNHSNAFGLAPIAGEFTRWGLTIMNLTVAAGLMIAIARGSYRRIMIIGFAFIIAGAIGNALDRVRFGAVIDFIDASKIGFIWVFNVADVSVDVGGVLIVLGVLTAGGRMGHLDNRAIERSEQKDSTSISRRDRPER